MKKTLKIIYTDTERPGLIFGQTYNDEEVLIAPQRAKKWSGTSGTGEGGTLAYLADNGFNLAPLTTRVNYPYADDVRLTEMVIFVDPATPVPSGVTLVVTLLSRVGNIASITVTAGNSGRFNAGESFTPYLVDSSDYVAIKVETSGSPVSTPIRITAEVR